MYYWQLLALRSNMSMRVIGTSMKPRWGIIEKGLEDRIIAQQVVVLFFSDYLHRCIYILPLQLRSLLAFVLVGYENRPRLAPNEVPKVGDRQMFEKTKMIEAETWR